MATRRNRTDIDAAPEPLPLGSILPKDIDNSGEDYDLLEAIQQLPSEDKAIQVWRMHPQGRPRYLGIFAPYEFHIEHLKATWGGGKYKIAFPLGGGRVERVVEIEGPPVIADNESRNFWGVNRDRNLGTPAVVPAGADAVQAAILQSLQELRQAILTKPADSAITQVLIQLLQNQNQGENKVLENMMKYKALFSSGGGTDANAVLQALKTGLDYAGAGPDPKSPWLELAERALPMIAQVFNRAASTAMPGDGPALGSMPENYQNGVDPMQNRPSLTPPTGFAAIAPQLKPFLPTFINAASRNTDPGLLAETTFNMLPSDQFANILTWLNSDQWFADLSSLSPLIIAQQSWWVEFRAALIDMIQHPTIENDNDSQDKTD